MPHPDQGKELQASNAAANGETVGYLILGAFILIGGAAWLWHAIAALFWGI